MARSMAGPQTPQSKPTNLGWWTWQLVFWLSLAAIFGQRHLEFGLALGFAGCLLFAVRLAFGPETRRILFVGFALGVVVEWGAYFSIVELVISDRLGPQAYDSLYPFTFQYWKIWPTFEGLEAQGWGFSSKTALNNGLTALGAGALTSGILAAFVSLLAWYRFGVRRFFERSITPTWRRVQQFAHSIGQRKSAPLARWSGSGVAIAAFIVATWWAPFGRAIAITVATLVLALFTLIGWLNARNVEPKPR
jgi:hypothetical protein